MDGTMRLYGVGRENGEEVKQREEKERGSEQRRVLPHFPCGSGSSQPSPKDLERDLLPLGTLVLLPPRMLDSLLHSLPASLAFRPPVPYVPIAIRARRIVVIGIDIIAVVQDELLFLSREFLLIRAAVPMRARTAVAVACCRSGRARPPFFVDRCP
jgi:hypothetical protein